MARRATRGSWSFADDRRFMQAAASLKTLEAVAKHLSRRPASVARMAKRLGVSLKRSDRRLKAKK
jgi:hypothetical protein